MTELLIFILIITVFLCLIVLVYALEIDRLNERLTVLEQDFKKAVTDLNSSEVKMQIKISALESKCNYRFKDAYEFIMEKDSEARHDVFVRISKMDDDLSVIAKKIELLKGSFDSSRMT